jgi:Fe-S oxidoreductase
MMRGETITDGWRSDEVNDALDLCLACKGCKSDCPVSVDMATYKAEFLSHRYARRLRPRTHYSLGWLPTWSRLAAGAPWAANAALHMPGVSRLAKWLAGVDPRRTMPRFARRRFTSTFRRRPPRPVDSRGPVVLWPDSFTNSFAPHIADSAVEALEAAGFSVQIPAKPVCCGLTWISTGQLGVAARRLRRTLDVLEPHLRAGTPIVGLEPSCTSVLRADAKELMRGGGADGQADPRYVELAEMLAAQTVTFAELLDKRAPEFAPRLGGGAGGRRRAIVQTHCHQHAILGDDADRKLMERIGLDAEVLDSGCCGLAGDFGMSKGHRDVSYACAERVLYPAVRQAGTQTLVLADGFSCRLQIASGDSGRRGVHLAEVVAAAVRGESVADHPERTVAP